MPNPEIQMIDKDTQSVSVQSDVSMTAPQTRSYLDNIITTLKFTMASRYFGRDVNYYPGIQSGIRLFGMAFAATVAILGIVHISLNYGDPVVVNIILAMISFLVNTLEWLALAGFLHPHWSCCLHLAKYRNPPLFSIVVDTSIIGGIAGSFWYIVTNDDYSGNHALKNTIAWLAVALALIHFVLIPFAFFDLFKVQERSEDTEMYTSSEEEA